MLLRIFYAVAFIFAGTLLFALLAPLVFPGGNMEQAGSSFAPVIFIVCGWWGYEYGARQQKKKDEADAGKGTP